MTGFILDHGVAIAGTILMFSWAAVFLWIADGNSLWTSRFNALNAHVGRDHAE